MLLKDALDQAERRFAAVGVLSPRADAEILAGHLLGMNRGEVAAAAIRGDDAPEGYDRLVDQRNNRIPLQHLTGEAPFRYRVLAVGPGVFIPRPETEVVAGAAIDAVRGFVDAARRRAPRVDRSEAVGPAIRPVVRTRDDSVEATQDDSSGSTQDDGVGRVIAVDLCTGSGAIAGALATEVDGIDVYAVEKSAEAAAYARRNLEGTGVTLECGDAATACAQLDGLCDVVVSNPPYIPPDGVPIDVEVRDYDPPMALFGGGPDGLDVPRHVVATAARLLKPGGVFIMEHGDVQGEAVRDLVASVHAFDAIHTSADLTGRPRYVSAIRSAASQPRP